MSISVHEKTLTLNNHDILAQAKRNFEAKTKEGNRPKLNNKYIIMALQLCEVYFKTCNAFINLNAIR